MFKTKSLKSDEKTIKIKAVILHPFAFNCKVED